MTSSLYSVTCELMKIQTTVYNLFSLSSSNLTQTINPLASHELMLRAGFAPTPGAERTNLSHIRYSEN